jgi:hydrogenase expression/formation protein HypE
MNNKLKVNPESSSGPKSKVSSKKSKMQGAEQKPQLDSRITLDYGSGGRKMHRLISEIFIKHFNNPILKKFEDSAELELVNSKPDYCFTIDSYVVQPIFFPDSDIGKLSICGTVNDLAVKGAKPLYIAVSFVIQEGMSLSSLEKICASIANTAKSAGVMIVTGDTKVIERRGQEDEIIITTAGIGKILPNFTAPTLSAKNIKIGDKVLINGNIGDHEASIILARGQFDFKAQIKSDCAPLDGLIETLAKAKCRIKMMRDPTRGGLATTLNEIADAAKLGISINETDIPMQKSVKGVSDILGFDPLYMANEGKVVIIADAKDANRILRIMKKHRLGKNSAIIGEVIRRKHGLGVWLNTNIGGQRPLLQLEGFQIPRIC